MLVSHERPEDLAITLRDLKRQTYQNMELIVIDDCSATPLENTVRIHWADAIFWRNEANLGAHQSRSAGMRRAQGEFILTLDDDSSPVATDAVERAVQRFLAEPELGVIAFFIHEGSDPPLPVEPDLPERYVHDFVNCGQMMRSTVAREVGDYQDFYQAYGEETDYALRVLDRGWRIRLIPGLQIHHRKSPVGRNSGRTIALTWRNAMWTIVLNHPFPRVLPALAWKFAGGMLEFARVREWRWGCWGVASFVGGLGKAWRRRRPMSSATVRLVDVLRFRWVQTADELANSRPPSASDRLGWYRHVWTHRRRHGRGVDGAGKETGTSVLHLGPRAK